VKPAFDTVEAPDELFRVGRRPDVWRWTDWKFVGCDRWDDPQHGFRVLYTSLSRLGAFLEVLAPLRPDPALQTGLRGIRSNDSGAPRTRMAGSVPDRWRHERIAARGIPDELEGFLVAIGGSRSIATLRRRLRGATRRFGLTDIDAAAIRLTAPRAFTQEVSRFVFEQVDEGGARYGGIVYLSKHGDDVVDCAIFERGGTLPVHSLERTSIAADDVDFLTACEMLGLVAE
jgi:hypothetical protein